MRTPHLICVLICTVASQLSANAADRANPITPTDRRIRTVPYLADQVTRLRGWVGYHTDIEFEPAETFGALAGGDLDGLSFEAYRNHLVLKPRAAALRTNLTVITDRRTYIFDYTVSSGAPDPFEDDLIYSLRFQYAPPAPVTTPAEFTQKLTAGEESRTRNYDYWFCGASELQPVAASDDGVHTRLRFAPSAEIPAMFVRSPDGTESLLNFSLDHGDVIIHRTARQFIVRRGKTVGCITNKGYAGSGDRLEGGTVAPNVVRETKRVLP